jgi:RNA polymerase sigma factor (sigma-70 family)
MGVVAAMNGHRSGRDVTRALIERAACGERGAALHSQVASWRPGASREQVEEAVQEACLRAERACHGQTEGEVFAWLRTTARRELGRIYERARREVLIDTVELARHADVGAAVAPEQELIEREDDVEIERIAHAVLGRLSDRQRQIAALHVRGRKRPQIATHLGMTPRTVKRQLERIMTVGRDELVRLAGEGCGAGEPLVARLAFGLASPREVRDAQLHLATCPRCGMLYERLDLWREKVAALTPVPAVAHTQPGLVESTVDRAGDALASLKQHVDDGAISLRQQAADGGAQLKQHSSAAYYRAADPTPLAGVRPGAAAAAIAGCLAIGGGTTYCVSQSVNPIGGLAQVVTPASETRPAAPKQRRARAQPSPSPSPAPAIVTPTAATPTPAPQPPAAQATPRPTPEPTPPPAPQDEYEPVDPVGSASQAQQPASTPSKPAPAPAGGPGEFDGP